MLMKKMMVMTTKSDSEGEEKQSVFLNAYAMAKKSSKSKKSKLKATKKKKKSVKVKKKGKKKNTLKSRKKKKTSSPQDLVLAATYDIWISGKKQGLAKKQCIQSLEIHETVEGADSATITIADPEFLFIEDNIFIEDNTIKIKLGWQSTTYRVTFDGYISAIDITFASDGIPKITVTCMDKTHKMNRKKQNKTYKNTTSAAVIKKIVKKYGFKPVIEKGYKFEKQETITQSNQTDAEFVTQLAKNEVHPFTARLVGKKFRYEKMGHLAKTPKMTLTYKDYPHEIIDFSPKINKESMKTEIKSASVHTGKKNVSSTTGKVGGSSKKSTTKGKSSGGGGSSSSNGSSASKKSSGGYTYNPNTKKWSKK